MSGRKRRISRDRALCRARSRATGLPGGGGRGRCGGGRRRGANGGGQRAAGAARTTSFSARVLLWPGKPGYLRPCRQKPAPAGPEAAG
jgi:hypothetical protein